MTSEERLTPVHAPDVDAAGWVAYGGVLLLILGAMYVLFAVVAISFHEWPVWAERDVLLLTPYRWGWVHLGVGALVASAGIGVLTGATTARRVAVAVVAAAMLTSFLAFTAFPLWATVKMVLGTMVLYCLVVRGGAAARRQHPTICRHE